MQYLHGGSYNGGNAPTITLSSTAPAGGVLAAVVRSIFIPYQMNDGTWRVKFNTVIGMSSPSARTNLTFAVAGLTFKSLSTWSQAITATELSSVVACQAFVDQGSNNFEINHVSTSAANYVFYGDVELDSKPTWAY
jgi:hypothetical protein